MTDPQPHKDYSHVRNLWSADVYKKLRAKLVAFFEHRGLSPAEDHAQEVFKRLFMKLEQIFNHGLTEKEMEYKGLARIYEKYTAAMELEDETSIEDLRIYAYGIAKNVCREAYKARKRDSLAESEEDVEAYQIVDPLLENEAAMHKHIFPEEVRSVPEQCLLNCLKKLPDEARIMILKYYETDKKKDAKYRKGLAQDLMVRQGTLDVKAYRIRQKLRTCLCRCIKEGLPDQPELWCKD